VLFARNDRCQASLRGRVPFPSRDHTIFLMGPELPPIRNESLLFIRQFYSISFQRSIVTGETSPIQTQDDIGRAVTRVQGHWPAAGMERARASQCSSPVTVTLCSALSAVFPFAFCIDAFSHWAPATHHRAMTFPVSACSTSQQRITDDSSLDHQ
jgi:hypothetical protein